MKNKLKVIIGLIIISLSIISCGEDDSGEQSTKSQTNTDDSSGVSGNDNQDGDSESMDVMNMTPEEIENILEERVFDDLEILNNQADLEINSPDTTDEQLEILSFAGELHDKAIEAFNDLSNEEKQLAAQFLVENNFTFGTRTSNKISGKICCDFEQETNRDISDLLIAKKLLVTGIGITALAIETPDLSYSKVIAILSGSFSLYQLNRVVKIRSSIVDRIFLVADNLLEEVLSPKSISNTASTSTLEFKYGLQRRLRVNSLGRKLQRADISSDNELISRATTEVVDADNKWNNLVSNIDKMINAVGSFFGILENKLDNTSGLPQSRNTETIQIDLNNLFLDNIPTNIGYNIDNLGSGIIGITFTNAEEEVISFTPNLVFDDGNFVTSNAFTVNLEPLDTGFDFSGSWTASWEVETCTPRGNSNDRDCLNHQNTRDYIFLERSNCNTLQCGIMDFEKIRNGNTDSPFQNQWTYDGNSLEIKIQSQSSSGFLFDFRDFQFIGTYNTSNDSFSGPYSAKYDGGLWRNEATGTLTLTRQ